MVTCDLSAKPDMSGNIAGSLLMPHPDLLKADHRLDGYPQSNLRATQEKHGKTSCELPHTRVHSRAQKKVFCLRWKENDFLPKKE
jgi:hypothetical protein